MQCLGFRVLGRERERKRERERERESAREKKRVVLKIEYL
jgi:hypothetical protein